MALMVVNYRLFTVSDSLFLSYETAWCNERHLPDTSKCGNQHALICKWRSSLRKENQKEKKEKVRNLLVGLGLKSKHFSKSNLCWRANKTCAKRQKYLPSRKIIVFAAPVNQALIFRCFFNQFFFIKITHHPQNELEKPLTALNCFVVIDETPPKIDEYGNLWR